MTKKLLVSPSPHVGSPMTTKKIMLNVILALSPAALASVFIFGLQTLIIMGLSVGACVLAEFLWNLIGKKEQTVSDLSAVVTGLLLGMNLPPVCPIYIPIISGFFAILVVKMLFGGLGKNFANPAITGRIFALLAWTGAMTSYVKPIDYSQGFFKALVSYFPAMFGSLDGLTGATPLAVVKASALGAPEGGVPVLNMLVGYTGGSIGEVCAIALLLGGVYLAVRKIIDWKIPTVYIVTVALCTLIFYKDGYQYILPMILGGGLMIGAFFMATDYATSPDTFLGAIIYAIGLGLMTVIIRRYGSYPEGVSFAILFMNLLTPLLDKYCKPRVFGDERKKFFVKKKKEAVQ